MDIVLQRHRAQQLSHGTVFTLKDNGWHFWVKKSSTGAFPPTSSANGMGEELPAPVLFCSLHPTRRSGLGKRRGSPAALTVKSLRASSEQLQANQPRAPSSKPAQLKENKTPVTLSLLPPGSATTVTTSTERDAGLCERGSRDTSALYWKDWLYKFSPPLRYTIKIQNTGHRLDLSINS